MICKTYLEHIFRTYKDIVHCEENYNQIDNLKSHDFRYTGKSESKVVRSYKCSRCGYLFWVSNHKLREMLSNKPPTSSNRTKMIKGYISCDEMVMRDALE